MKFKSILSVAAFSAAFILSAALCSMFKVETKNRAAEPVIIASPISDYAPTSCFGHRNHRSANISVASTIDALLKQDDANGRKHSAKTESMNLAEKPLFTADETSFSEYAAATAVYVEESGAMKDDGLPTEFQAAWRAHMKAWRDYADFLEALKTPEMRDAMDEDSFAQIDEQYSADIKQTYIEVLRVAAVEGADASKYFSAIAD